MEKVFHRLTAPITTPTNSNKVGKVGLGAKREGFKKEWIIFLLVLLFFPANLAKHFEIPSAYVQGVLVDYLLPKIYLTEILVLLLLVCSFIRAITTKSLNVRYLLLFLLLLLPFSFSLWISDYPLSSFSRFFELVLWGGFAFWVKKNINWVRDRRLVLQALSFGVGWVALLALAQFLSQQNIFGYYFLGEPVLYPSLGGVAKTSFMGREVLRAYGTFPHPNVLGGTMAVITPWLFASGYFFPAMLGLLAIFVSFSRLAWVCLLLGLFLLGISKTKGHLKVGLMALFLPLLFLILTSLSPAIDSLSLIRRVELLQSAWRMVCSSPFAGVGLGLFTAKLPTFGLPSGPTLFLQPVHNIFALIAAESGLLALVALLFVLVRAFREVWRDNQSLLFISLGQLTLLGLFDHYLYTFPQGLFLFSLTLGLIFSYAEGDGKRPAHPTKDITWDTGSSDKA